MFSKQKNNQSIIWLTLLYSLAFCNQPDTIYSFSFSNKTIRFCSNGDLLDIKLRYEIPEVSEAEQIFSSSEIIPILKLKATSNSLLDSCIQHSPARLKISETDSNLTLLFLSQPFLNTGYEKKYVLNKNDYSINFKLIFLKNGANPVTTDSSIQIQLSLRNESNRDLYQMYIGKKFRKSNLNKPEVIKISSENNWVGFRNRFWAICIRPDFRSKPFSFSDQTVSCYLSNDSSHESGYTIFAGPVVYKELKKSDPKLTRHLYPLPFWMRWLSFAFLVIFDTLMSLSSNVIISLILLSVCVKIILAPLFKIASIWQKQVNEQSSLLQPKLDEIKKKYKGEEQTKQTLAAYKELGISPLYTLKSLLSAAIQIPVFFAAYHMLSEHIVLSNSSFLWINDLSSPDHLFKLPFNILLFGNYFNILPFVMTFFTFASSWLHSDASLSPILQKKQRINLFWMAGLFFLLLYTSPAGMVIYWTMNNILAFLSTATEKFIPHKSTISMDKK